MRDSETLSGILDSPVALGQYTALIVLVSVLFSVICQAL